MSNKIDMVGYKVGKLTVISENTDSNNGYYWNCLCECGNITVVSGANLRRKISPTKSCGCIGKRYDSVNTSHGLSKSRINRIYHNMRARCTNKNHKYYYNYGGRGINICKEWNNFENFAEWAFANGYSDNLTIERIDVDLGYSPDNCVWIPVSEQKFNRRIPSNNKSGYPGISFDKKYKKYVAKLVHEKKWIHIGTYNTFLEALSARRNLELETYGQYLYELPEQFKELS